MENEMGQELLDRQGWIKKPRKYFVATNSNGYKAIRGSADRNYEWCVIAKEVSQWGSIYASWSKTEHNAKKYCTTWNNREADRYEVVKCIQVTAKEARVIKKEINLQILKANEYMMKEALEVVSAGKNLQEQENN
jgi:hypothetical protein